MDAFATARAAARLWRGEAVRESGGDITAAALIAAALRISGLTACAVDDDDICLCGAEAALDREAQAIFFKASVPQALAHFQIAHELGHFWMEQPGEPCDQAALELGADEALPFGAARIEGYGPRQRRECQANIFARSFLLPEDMARDRYLAGDCADVISNTLGLQTPLVIQQLARGTLLPPDAPAASPNIERPLPPLDPSQAAAAHVSRGPLLVEAGPGTGKTRTLVARVEHLLSLGINPSAILILTFSNKAAEELRERIARVAPEAATQIWAGTFHAFGLDLLRRFGHYLGLPEHVRPVDLNEALGILEDILPTLPLDHYLMLHEPVQMLSEILKAISRAKDELVTPAGYGALGSAMPAADEEQSTARAKVLEIAAVYAHYQDALQARGAVDFGDLIMRCCELLNGFEAVREQVRGEYRHILVDEFQDVNRASAILLRHLSGRGEGLWVVGDARQSIYRFRGASPDNLTLFEEDYPGAQRLALAVNYRSSSQIVDAFATFASAMQAARGSSCQWDAFAGAGAPIDYNIAQSLESEADGLAAIISGHRAAGIAYGDQAILCRSHTMLGRLAKALEGRGVPILYLGDVFERPEVRDLLSLASLAGEKGSSGLVRVGGLTRYGIPFAELRAICRVASEKALTQRDLVHSAIQLELSDQARRGLERLREDIADVLPGVTASSFFHRYLFERSGLPRGLVADQSVAGAQRRLAIHQLLRAASSYAENEPGGGLAGFLDWVRRLEMFGEERQLRTPPAAANPIDAVRLMTVHASKGLEFRVVYLPGLATSYFPSSGRFDPCPPPPGLIAHDPTRIRIEEEECLFFVALSRAREQLHLSRACAYGANRSASTFLKNLGRCLPRAADAPANWADTPMTAAPATSLLECGVQADVHSVEDLDQYLRCPRSYLYQRVLNLNAGRADNGYVRFHRSVYAVLRELASLRGDADPHRAALVRLDEAWVRIGPIDHPYEALYRRQAELLLQRAVAAYLDTDAQPVDWLVPIGTSAVRVRPDFILSRSGGAAVRRFRTGRAPKTAPDDDIYALYAVGAQSNLGGAEIGVHYLGSDRVVPVSLGVRALGNRIEKYSQAIDGIGRGQFPMTPSDRVCPRCPQYFSCGAPEA